MTRDLIRSKAFAVLSLLACLLLACSEEPTPALPRSGSTQAEPQIITFACSSYPHSRYAELADRFHEQNPDIVVQVISADPSGGIAPETRLANMAAVADTFLAPIPAQHDLRQQQDALLALTPLLEGDRSFSLDDYYPALLKAMLLDDTLWGVPVSVDTAVLYYDRDAFDAADIPYPQPGWTWDEFLLAAQQFVVIGEEDVARYGVVDLLGAPFLASLAQQSSGTLWMEQVERVPALQAPGIAPALAWYVDLIAIHQIMPNPLGDADEPRGWVRDGRAAMWIDRLAAYDEWSSLSNRRIGIAPFPEQGPAAHPFWPRGYFVSAGTTHPEAAWRWIAFLAQQPVEQYYFAPARRSLAVTSSLWQGLDRESQAALEYVLSHGMVADDAAVHGLEVALFAVLNDGQPVEQALALGQQDAVAVLASSAMPVEPVAAVPTPEPIPGPSGVQITFFPTGDWQRAAYEMLIPEFETAHPDIVVSLGSPPRLGKGSLDDYIQGFQRADCFAYHLSPWWLAQFRERDAILDLTPLVEADASFDLDDFPPSIVAHATREGRLWALPFGSSPLMWFYHRERFAAAALELPTPSWMADDFVSAALTLAEQGGEGVAGPVYGFQAFESDYVQAAGSFLRRWYDTPWIDFSTGTARPTLDSPEMVRAISQFGTLIEEQALYPLPVDLHGTTIAELGGYAGDIDTGRVGMWVTYWFMHDMAPTLTFDAGIAPWPQQDNTFFVSAFFVSAGTSSPGACWRWIEFLGGAQPDLMDVLPVRWSALESTALQARMGEDALNAYRTILESEPTIAAESLPTWVFNTPGYWLGDVLSQVVAGIDPATALADAQPRAEAWVACVENAGESQEQVETCYRDAGLLDE